MHAVLLEGDDEEAPRWATCSSARRWAPAVLESIDKEGTHLALDDVRESIAELRHYRRHLFAEAWRGSPPG